jgi:xanthine/uracil permease
MSETVSEVAQRPMPGTRLRGFSAGVILVVGVVLVPMALGLIFNSSSAPDAAAYVRMAFAQVAGATIAIITVLGLLLHRIVRRSPFITIAWFAFIALIIGSWQLSAINGAAELLLTRLSAVA